MDRRKFVATTAATAAVSSIPSMAVKTAMAAEQNETTAGQLVQLTLDYLEAAKALDPSLKGAWMVRSEESERMPLVGVYFRWEGESE